MAWFTGRREEAGGGSSGIIEDVKKSKKEGQLRTSRKKIKKYKSNYVHFS